MTDMPPNLTPQDHLRWAVCEPAAAGCVTCEQLKRWVREEIAAKVEVRRECAEMVRRYADAMMHEHYTEHVHMARRLAAAIEGGGEGKDET